MKKLLLITIMGLTFNGFAQPVLNMNNLPIIGDTTTEITIDTTGQTYSQGPSGASQTWTFAVLPKKDSDRNAWISPTGTPYFSNFPSANIANVSMNITPTTYSYEDNQANTAYVYGSESTSLKTVYVSSMGNYFQSGNYPFTYLDSYIRIPTSITTAGTDSIREKTFDTTTADAYGKLILAGKTYNNAIRLSIHYTIFDSIFINKSLYYTDTVRTIEYMWYDAGYRNALFAITYNNVKPSVNQHPSVTLWRNPNPVTPAALQQVNSKDAYINVYPNPNNGTFQLTINNGQLPINSQIEIYNMLGEKVYSQLANSHQLTANSQITINLSNEPGGIYLLKVISQDGSVVTNKLEITK